MTQQTVREEILNELRGKVVPIRVAKVGRMIEVAQRQAEIAGAERLASEVKRLRPVEDTGVNNRWFIAVDQALTQYREEQNG